jgi:hypothetical protein
MTLFDHVESFRGESMRRARLLGTCLSLISDYDPEDDMQSIIIREALRNLDCEELKHIINLQKTAKNPLSFKGLRQNRLL